MKEESLVNEGLFKIDDLQKDKIVTLRLAPLDIFEVDYIYQNCFVVNKFYFKCTEVFNLAIYDLYVDLINANDPNRYLNSLRGKREKLLKDKRFNNLLKTKICETELAYGKPYNIYMYSKILNEIQKHLIQVGDIWKPHSSWITQLALLNSFMIIAEKKGEFTFDIEDNIVGEKLNDFDKFDLIEKVVGLFKNEDLNRDKIEKIKKILESE